MGRSAYLKTLHLWAGRGCCLMHRLWQWQAFGRAGMQSQGYLIMLQATHKFMHLRAASSTPLAPCRLVQLMHVSLSVPQVLCSVSEFDDIPVRHNEDKLNAGASLDAVHGPCLLSHGAFVVTWCVCCHMVRVLLGANLVLLCLAYMVFV